MTAAPLPAGPSPADPRLADLRRRYRELRSPLTGTTHWSPEFVARDLDLATFRGDNCFVWQGRYFGEAERLKYYVYADYVSRHDTRGLLAALGEDGAFGCQTHTFERFSTVSRDLLDSVNEISFLDRHLGLLGRQGTTIIDVGAGYGRLAHRMVQAVAGLGAYYCADGIPESTYVCEFYLRHRGAGHLARTVAADELDEVVAPGACHLAINIHSFCEMPYTAADAWLGFLASRRVPLLFTVPNFGPHPTACEEVGARQRDLMPAFTAHGYRLVVREPAILEPDVQELVGGDNHFLLFALAR
ncbi:putative sugar O-methyltransferase [Nonomuraea soli]|uniref:Class I SAM-dependent methyltransferase n=1 Tax=Nonomuraea soli TaxID=1032476 RepID=A0A7W0CD40_9ACTN|nr:putative sugar O-methyltransferase [Nonomuraea soli]MBA2888931.1 hypothetical protein [Nonomuraea soli]